MTADELRRLDDEALGSALARLDLRWPATPDVTADVAAGIRDGRGRRTLGTPARFAVGGRPSHRRRVLLIAAALLTVGAAAGAAKLLFDLGAVTIERIPGRPTSPGPVFPGAAFGEPITRNEAEAALGSAFATPSVLGEPDAFWLQEPAIEVDDPAPWVVAGWRATPTLPPIDGTGWGAILVRFRGEADVASKGVAPGGGTRLEVVDLDGRRALWIEGSHELELPVDGRLERFRVRGNVLLVDDDDDTLRFESELPLGDAIQVMRSIM